MREPKLCIAFPCYNESKSIPSILKRFSEIIGKRPVELVLVDNGSVDDTQDVLVKELKNQQYKFARSVKIDRNFGYGYGIMYGLKSCKADLLAFSHADQQCDPLDIIKAYDRWIKTNNRGLMVKGDRKKRIFSEYIITTGMHVFASIVFLKRFNDINGQPKLFHESFLEKLKKPPNDFKFDFYVQYIAIKNNMKIDDIPVEFGKRKHGQSNWAYSIFSRLRTYTSFVLYMLRLRWKELFNHEE